MAEKPEDLNLPNAVINRIIKESLPEGAIISKEARSAISKAASIFVLYSTSWANNFAAQQKRKTLKDTDVMAAVEEMEFDVFLPTLQSSLDSFKREKKDAAEKKKKSKEISVNLKEQIENENSEVPMEANDSNISDGAEPIEEGADASEKPVVID